MYFGKRIRGMSRIGLAFEAGLAKPSEKTVLLHPDVNFDVTNLSNVLIVEPFFPSNIAWQNKGYCCKVSLPYKPFELAIVCCTRSRQQTSDLIAQASAQADLVVVDGQKVDGIEAHYKLLRKLVEIKGNVTKGHGRLFWFSSADLSNLRATPQSFNNFTTIAGVFSANAVDQGSELLAAALPENLRGDVADFGAGWGFLSSKILNYQSVISLDLIEADATALEYAKLNIKDPRANFHWDDATAWNGSYDAIIMNPPFHKGRLGNPDLGRAFIINAARCLRPKGDLWMVANRHLPYENVLNQCFENVSEILGNSQFKLFHSSRPKRK